MFAYSNNKHATTGALPFYLYTGHNLRLDADLGKVSDGKLEVPEATTRVAGLLLLHNEPKERWLETVKTQTKYYNNKVTPR